MKTAYFDAASLVNWTPNFQVTGDFTRAEELLVFNPPPMNPLSGLPDPAKLASGELIELSFDNNVPLPLSLHIQGSLEGLSEFWKRWSQIQRDAVSKEISTFDYRDPVPLRLGLYNIYNLDLIASGSKTYLTVYKTGVGPAVDWQNGIIARRRHDPSYGEQIEIDLRILALQYWGYFAQWFWYWDKQETYRLSILNWKSFRFLYEDISNACKNGGITYKFPVLEITGTNFGGEEVWGHNRSSLASIIREQGTSWPTINPNGKRSTSNGSSFRN